MSEFTVTLVALTLPNFTVDVSVKFVPMMVTVVPPAAVPLVGEIAVTVGAGPASVTVI